MTVRRILLMLAAASSGVAAGCSLLADFGGIVGRAEVDDSGSDERAAPIADARTEDKPGLDAADAQTPCEAGRCCVAQIAAGTHTTCALLVDGSVYCWGANRTGALGVGIADRVAHPVPSKVEGLPPVEEISMSADTINGDGERSPDHVCTRTRSGDISCWGSNTSGELGVTPDAVAHGPTKLSLAGPYKGVTAGAIHTCATHQTGVSYCWGNNIFGLLGVSPTGGYTPTPQRVGVPPNVRITAGALFTCALNPSLRTVACFGDNQLGEIGTLPVDTQPHPDASAVVGPVGIGRVSAALAHACVDTSEGPWCWGYNAYGQLGSPGDDDGGGGLAASPRRVPLPASVLLSSVTAGGNGTCALDQTGAPWCWGLNTEGQGGVPGGGYLITPTRASVVSDGGAGVSLALGYGHTCMIDSTDSVICWGANTFGELGNGTSDPPNDGGPSIAHLPSRVKGLPCPR